VASHVVVVGVDVEHSEPDAAAAVENEEQRVVAAQDHTLDGEEIAGDDARSLRRKNCRG
jgi:hypothetical protein